MRGATTDDGKLTGNRQMVDRYNEAKGKKKSKSRPLAESAAAKATGAEQRASETGGHSAGEREPSGHDEIKSIREEHGAAIHHAIHRTGDGYHSVSHHEDGHVHHADHGTLGEAHEHGAHAFGEDTEKLGDMGKEDAEVAEEHEGMEAGGSGSRYGGTRSVGYMS